MRPEAIRENVPLAPYTAYRVGGPARYFLETADQAVLQEGVRWALQENQPVFVLGAGYNLLIADRGVPGLTVRWVARGIVPEGEEEVRVEGGTLLPHLVEWSLEQGWGGLEWAAGLPGTVGAAVRGNVGAFGGDMAQVVSRAEVLPLQRDASITCWPKEQLGFEYRGSRVKQQGVLVLRAWVRLRRLQGQALAEARQAASQYLAYRQSHHPLESFNCGSVFKNVTRPEQVESVLAIRPDWRERVEQDWHGKIPAAALIEAAGLKGAASGGAWVSERHANFIIHQGKASAADIAALLCQVQRKVQKRFGVQLVPEVQLVGFEEDGMVHAAGEMG